MPSIDLGQVIGQAGPGVAAGGTTGQVLVKTGAGNFDTGWKTLAASDVGALPQTQADARYLKLSGGTMTGAVTANNDTSYSASKVRNIYFTQTDLTAGSSSLPSGSIAIVYE